MYQQWLVSILIASAPVVALQQPPAQKPSAPPPAQKPANPSGKPAAAGPQKADPAAAKASAKGVRTVEIIGTDDMKFSVASIPAKAGEQLRIRLVSKGGM